MFEDAMTYPEHIIKELKARIKELEEEVKSLKSDKSWRESSYRASMVSKYGGEDW